ncbi:MAG: transcriptional regulator, LacI family [Solirubrobacterales bacterium]|jgi:LacI family transcriptional regulator|nr:transcriptional regulator, LacI family [Solirubrobacterales bacterium]
MANADPGDRVTLKDVARRAGVHPGTASRALNAETRELVNGETAERVLAAAEELGYRPNPIARGLKTSRSYTVGVLIPDLTNPLFPPIVRGIQDRLEEAAYTPLIVNTDNDPDRERADIEAMRARQVDGLITATARRDQGLPAGLERLSLPVVLVNRRLEDGARPSVVADDRKGIGLAVEHLLSLGHRRIAHLAGPQELSTGHLRHDGFIEAMRAAGIDPDPELVLVGTAFIESEGERLCNELLDRELEVTAIVAGNDLMAVGCYDVFVERGIDCPGEISVVGYNDMPFVGWFSPPLTTVHLPHYEIGARAAGLLLDQLRDPEIEPAQVLLEPELVVRGSTAAPLARDGQPA